MKQGTLATKIVMLVLLVGIIAYFSVYAIKSASDPFETQLVYLYKVENAVASNGYLVRDEEVLPPASGLVNLILSEGEKVQAGQTIATVYSSKSALKTQQELTAKSNQLSQLQSLAESSDESMDKAKLNENIVSSLFSLREAVSSQSLSNLSSMSSNLKSLIFKRDYTYDDEQALEDMIGQTQKQVNSLEKEASQGTKAIAVSHPGTFSGVVDGYETTLTVKGLDTMTPSGYRSLSSRKTPASPENQLGKLIFGTTWYFVTVLPSKQASGMSVGETATLRFARDFTQSIPMTIKRISSPENGQVLAVFSCDRYLSQITLLRTTTADIIFNSHAGLRIPKEAIRVKNGTPGVYCVEGAQAAFKKVDIIYQGNSYYLAALNGSDPDSLRANDEVIVAGENMYTGKIMQK